MQNSNYITYVNTQWLYLEKETRKEDYQVAYRFVNLITYVKREDNFKSRGAVRDQELVVESIYKINQRYVGTGDWFNICTVMIAFPKWDVSSCKRKGIRRHFRVSVQTHTC